MLRHRWILVLALLLSLPAAGMAQTSTTEAGYAYATVEEIPITLTLASQMHFGVFAPWGQAGSVTVSATAQPPSSGSRVTISGQGYPARFNVTGTPNAPFTVVLPADRTITVSSPHAGMVIDYFFSSYNDNGTTPVLSASGTAAFTVGAKLLVNANQSPGIYSGSFPVTVAY